MKAEENWIAKLQVFFDNIGQVTFDGDIRRFPRFKSDFDRYVKPSVSPDSCSYVLKSCLTGKELHDLVRNVDDDPGKMWQRSNDKFGQASKLKGEAGYRDLAMVRCQHEFANTTVIGLIESKLPKSRQRVGKGNYQKGV